MTRKIELGIQPRLDALWGNGLHGSVVALISVLLLCAAWLDVRSHRIPNSLILAGAAAALLLNVWVPSAMGELGLQASLLGVGAGLLALMPLYLLRAMGGGDVKLMAMVGAFVGPGAMMEVTLYVLIAGGVLAIGVSLWRGNLWRVVHHIKLALLLKLAKMPGWREPIDAAALRADHRMPYGVAIACGGIAYLLAA